MPDFDRDRVPVPIEILLSIGHSADPITIRETRRVRNPMQPVREDTGLQWTRPVNESFTW
jgi:hypothetical protein